MPLIHVDRPGLESPTGVHFPMMDGYRSGRVHVIVDALLRRRYRALRLRWRHDHRRAGQSGAKASVDQSTVWKFETGKSQASGLSASTIKRTLEAAGVEFTDGGVKLKAKARMLGSRPGI
jgi:hypothetical protein